MGMFKGCFNATVNSVVGVGLLLYPFLLCGDIFVLLFFCILPCEDTARKSSPDEVMMF